MSKIESSDKRNKLFSRRDFLKLIPPALLAGFWSNRYIPNVQAVSNRPGINMSGRNFDGWTVDLGDALYSRLGEASVDLNDIETTHLGKYSELRANIKAARDHGSQYYFQKNNRQERNAFITQMRLSISITIPAASSCDR